MGHLSHDCHPIENLQMISSKLVQSHTSHTPHLIRTQLGCGLFRSWHWHILHCTTTIKVKSVIHFFCSFFVNKIKFCQLYMYLYGKTQCLRKIILYNPEEHMVLGWCLNRPPHPPTKQKERRYPTRILKCQNVFFEPRFFGFPRLNYFGIGSFQRLRRKRTI